MDDQDILEPPLYFAEDHIFDIDFHSQSNIMACSLITGEVRILQYDSEDVKEAVKLFHHQDSCRTCMFSQNGQILATGSKDRTIGIVDANGKVIQQITDAHDDPINIVYFLNDNMLVSGDDEGEIKIWDLNQKSSAKKCIFQVQEQDGCINGLTRKQDDLSKLLAVSSEGTLCVFDIRKLSKNKVYAKTDSVDEDLLAVSLMKDERFVVCSSSEGVLYIYKWDWFGQDVDRIQGHPNSIDTILKLDENTLLTGSEDGFLRGVSMYPNGILSILGNHSEDEEHFPIQKIGLSHCRNICASTSHDDSIKFYDVAAFRRGREKLVQGDQRDDYILQEKLSLLKVESENQNKIEIEQDQNECKDSLDDESSSNSIDESESVDNEIEEEQKETKQLKNNIKKRQKQIKKTQQKQFFKDL